MTSAAISPLLQLKNDQGNPVKLLAVTKTRKKKEIQALLDQGVKHIGENRLQEILEKYDNRFFHELQAAGVQLHYIGQIQSNKVTKLVRLCDSLDSVDSLRMAQKINLAARELNKTMPLLLQVNLTREPQKSGLEESELGHVVKELKQFSNLDLRGLMTMGKRGDKEATRAAFKRCRELCDEYNLSECSMGMTEDYPIALEENSSMIRLGRALFDH